MLTTTLTLTKLLPSSVSGSLLRHTSLMLSQISSATTLDISRMGISSTWTQKLTLLNLRSLSETSLVSLYKTTKCLSKIQGSLLIIRSTSEELSNTNNTLWSPRLRILKPLTDRHNCLNVLPTASIFKTRDVINFAAIINSSVQRIFVRQKSELYFF